MAKKEKTKIMLYFFKDAMYPRHMFVGEDEDCQVRPEHSFYELLKEIDETHVDRIGDYDIIGLCLPWDVSEESLNEKWSLVKPGASLKHFAFQNKEVTLHEIQEKGLRQAIIDALDLEEDDEVV